MFSTASEAKDSSPARTAKRIALFYVLIAAGWILLSDLAVSLLVSDPGLTLKLQTVKGWLFVLFTGVLLYLYLHHCLLQLHHSEHRGRNLAREQFRQMARLFDSFNALVYIADLETNELLYVNPYATNFYGKDWRGKTCFSYLREPATEPCGLCTNPQLRERGPGGSALIWEFRNPRDQRWYECVDKVIDWGENRQARLEIAFDITERKELEATKDELLSTVSHEMRTPLTAITGFVELLLDTPDLPDQALKHLQIVAREAENMTHLVNNFLDLRRLKTDRARVDYQPLKVADLLEKGVAAGRENRRNRPIQIEAGNNLQVFGNQQELIRVIAQLVDNACRFAPDGTPIVLAAAGRNDQVVITVCDQGPGIPEVERQKVFEHFHRLDRGDTRRSRGLGIGLSLAKEVIELHGGEISIRPHGAAGSCVQLILPIYREPGAEPAPQDEAGPPSP